ncbi:DNA repair protein RecO [Enhydrobacter aerosaccus]
MSPTETRHIALMEWTDRGIVLTGRPHGEGGLVASLLTRDHGRHAGFVPGGGSRRARPIWQPGNLVDVVWRARLAEQLGNYSGELREAYAARALDDASELAGLAAACATIDTALPEREPHPAVFEGFHAFLAALGHAGWPMIYVRLELGLLQELGFGLDLEKCAVSGDTEDLAFVSPRTGRAVSRAAAGPYKEKLLPLPAFLSTGGLPADDDELHQGLDLTGYFLERHVFWPQNKPLPPARSRFKETLHR